MSFRANSHVEDGVATLRLSGALPTRAAGQLDRLLAGLAEQRPRRLVLLMHDLTEFSAAGVRSLAHTHQKLGHDVEILLVGCRPAVANNLRLAGFGRSAVIQEIDEPRPAHQIPIVTTEELSK